MENITHITQNLGESITDSLDQHPSDPQPESLAGGMESNPQSGRITELLPEKPEEPQQSDCCGTGCSPCVFDIYQQDIETWEKECRRIKAGIPRTIDTSSKQESAVSPSEYRLFTIESVAQDAMNTYIYRFSIPNGGRLGIKSGQHLVLMQKKEGRSLTRQYTPISDIMTEGYFDVMIKLYDNGSMSKYVRTWCVGDEVEWRGPFGNFTYTPNKWRRVLMLTAGSGIAPMAQVITTILNNEEDETFIRLCYACQTYEEILIKNNINSWADYWNFSVAFFLSKDSAERECKRRYGDDINYSRITKSIVESELGGKANDTLVLICGTKSFDKDMVNYLKRLGVPEENYFKF